MGEESPFIIDESSSTGLGSGNVGSEQDEEISVELTEL